MSLYNMLFGRNGKSALLLAVLGLRENDIERFRDVFVSEDGATISVYTRTGGGNRDDYPNLTMRKRPEWAGSSDDDYDSTYCTDHFTVPEQWRSDVAGLGDVLKHGIRPEFGQHLALTLQRAPSESDKEAAAYADETAALARTNHFKANGHTFVPLDDHAMKTALDLAEKNGGQLRSCWGIMPLMLNVRQNYFDSPNAKDETVRLNMVRAKIDYDFGWAIDEAYWTHTQRFAATHPLAMAKIAEAVESHRKRKS